MKQEKQQYKPTIILVAVALMLMSLPSVSSIVSGGQILDSSNNTVDLYYSTISNSFTDGISGNPNVKLRIIGDNAADVANRYVGAVYAVNTSGSNPLMSVITADSVPPALGQTGAAFVCGGNWCADTALEVNFQTNTAATGDGAAFFPGNVFVFVSNNDNINFGAGDELAPVVSGVSGSTASRSTVIGSNGTLRGRYTANGNLASTYNQATGNVNFGVIEAYGTPNTGSDVVISTSHPNDPFVLMGLCDDVRGLSCDSVHSGNLSMGQVSMNTGIVNPPDTIKTTKYSVINGLGIGFCIGPDVSVSSVTKNPSGGFPGTVFNITATVQNVGNVNVTKDFNVSFYDVAAGFLGSRNISGGLPVGSSKSVWILYNTGSFSAGTRTINVYSNHTDVGIADCNNGNNQGSTSIILAKAYMLNFFINGNKTTTFDSPGRIYNITAVLNDTDGNLINNATIRITEENGLSLFAPMQIFNETPALKNGVKPITTAEVRTSIAGKAEFALAPSGNPLYYPPYASSNVEHYHGNYTVYAEAFSPSGGKYQLVQMPSFTFIDRVEFNFTNNTIQYPNASQLASEQYKRQNNFVQQVYDFIDQAFAAAFRRMNLI